MERPVPMALLDPSARFAAGARIAQDVAGEPTPEPASQRPAGKLARFRVSRSAEPPALDRRSRFFIAMSGAAITGGDTVDLEGYVRGGSSIQFAADEMLAKLDKGLPWNR